ncbi:hypothetical protein RFI_30792 [Reticulomyxa filosa]|uniref:Uncharacterized protein n=1 Tax=Reticulomyxa filosa TaxID=46433 RepID=X6LY98_RETFI|nr:hypothetical protein RFI_30792 [Reticulomyxa filosa]|eukprot:ETO06599.1 hypothetical protein RFI_30792 [Reticulomyxa filosa]
MGCGFGLKNKSRIVSLAYNKSGNLLFVQTNSNVIDLFHVRGQFEMNNRRQARFQQLRNQQLNQATTDETAPNEKKELKLEDVPFEVADYLTHLTPIRTTINIGLLNDTRTKHSNAKESSFAKFNASNSANNEDPDDDTEGLEKKKICDVVRDTEELDGLKTLRQQIVSQNLDLKKVLLQPILCGYDNNSIAMYHLAYPNVDEILMDENENANENENDDEADTNNISKKKKKG